MMETMDMTFGCLGFYQSTSVTSIWCSHCKIQVALASDENEFDAAAKAHHATCTARPLEVGDYVRWESGVVSGRWVEGDLVKIVAPDDFEIRCTSRTPGYAPLFERSPGVHGFLTRKGGTIRRIPRPDVTVRTPVSTVTDPLDVEYDDVSLRRLIAQDRCNHQEWGVPLFKFTPAQRAAVSAHWSAALRAKVQASREAECNVVRCDLQDEP